jgi:hypothetical protein
MISQSFEKNLSTGSVGEDIVLGYLKKKFGTVYTVQGNGSHCFDGIVYTKDYLSGNSANNSSQFIFDVKTKPRMIGLCETGFDFYQYKRYEEISNSLNIPFIVFFVDWWLKKCYAANIATIETRVVAEWGTLSWPLDKMVCLFDLAAADSEELQHRWESSNKNGRYFTQYTDAEKRQEVIDGCSFSELTFKELVEGGR